MSSETYEWILQFNDVTGTFMNKFATIQILTIFNFKNGMQENEIKLSLVTVTDGNLRLSGAYFKTPYTVPLDADYLWKILFFVMVL